MNLSKTKTIAANSGDTVNVGKVPAAFSIGCALSLLLAPLASAQRLDYGDIVDALKEPGPWHHYHGNLWKNELQKSLDEIIRSKQVNAAYLIDTIYTDLVRLQVALSNYCSATNISANESQAGLEKLLGYRSVHPLKMNQAFAISAHIEGSVSFLIKVSGAKFDPSIFKNQGVIDSPRDKLIEYCRTEVLKDVTTVLIKRAKANQASGLPRSYIKQAVFNLEDREILQSAVISGQNFLINLQGDARESIRINETNLTRYRAFSLLRSVTTIHQQLTSSLFFMGSPYPGTEQR